MSPSLAADYQYLKIPCLVTVVSNVIGLSWFRAWKLLNGFPGVAVGSGVDVLGS